MPNATPITVVTSGQATPAILSPGGSPVVDMPVGNTTPVIMVSSGNAWPIAYDSFSLDFGSGVLPSGMTFTRASAAWGFNSSGVLTAYATDAPRFVYDPATLQNLGLLIEGARTNSVRNSTCIGAVPGTPGTPPTIWVPSGTGDSVTRTIVGSGVEDGIEYVDIQYSGTPTASGTKTVSYNLASEIVAAQNQIWSYSVFVRLVGGSLTNISPIAGINERDAAGAFIAQTVSGITPTSASLRTQRITYTRTMVSASTGCVSADIRFPYTIALPFDITLRIGLPQLEVMELGAGVFSGLAGASSPIKTSTVAVTRAVETARITDSRVLTDQAFIVKGRMPYNVATTSVAQMILAINDGTQSNTKYLARNQSGLMDVRVVTGGVSQAILNPALASNADYGMAVRFATNDVAFSLNGAAVLTDLAATMPSGLTTATIGNQASTNNYYFGTVRSIETRATASDAELQALSFSPEVLGASLIAWWDAADASTITEVGGLVSQWRDKVAGYAMNASGGQRPTYNAPNLVFNGTTNIFVGPTSMPLPTGANPVWLWGVATQDAPGNSAMEGTIFQYGSAGATTQSRRITRANISNVSRATCAAGTGASLPVSIQVTTDYSGRHVHLGKISGTTLEALVDGVGVATTAAVPATGATLSGVTIGAAFNGGNFWLGNINTVMVTLPLTAQQEASLTSYLMARL